MIEKTFRGTWPHLPVEADVRREVYSLLGEHDRMATFRQSEKTQGGKVAPFRSTPRSINH